MTLVLPAPAKLNLFLHIVSRREDGYHNIQTLFRLIDFSDELSFILREDASITLKITGIDCPVKDNLVLNAARLLQTKMSLQRGVDIVLKKQIPLGAGLGGGSSNAATTLLGLNYLWELGFSIDELAELGRELGADVPVFVRGHTAWAEGIGDILTPMILPECWYVLMMPNCQICTTNLFSDPRLVRDSVIMDMNSYTYGEGHNDFEPVVRLDYPEISQALDWLDARSRGRMTGTGSTIFASFDTREEASRIASEVPAGYQAVVARGLNESSLRAALACN